MFDAGFAYPGSAAAIWVKTSPEGCVVGDKVLAFVASDVGEAAGVGCFVAVVGTVEEPPAGAPPGFFGALELSWDIEVSGRGVRWRWWCFAETAC